MAILLSRMRVLLTCCSFLPALVVAAGLVTRAPVVAVVLVRRCCLLLFT
jgi:hypothetical protein